MPQEMRHYWVYHGPRTDSIKLPAGTPHHEVRRKLLDQHDSCPLHAPHNAEHRACILHGRIVVFDEHNQKEVEE